MWPRAAVGSSSSSTVARPRWIERSNTAAVAALGSSSWSRSESRRRHERRRRLVGCRRDDVRRRPRGLWRHPSALCEGDGGKGLRQAPRLLLSRCCRGRAAGREPPRHPVLRAELRRRFPGGRDRSIHPGYLEGRTPNPCIRCNETIKFGLLLKKALALGADLLATGHYARIATGAAGYTLRKAADERKDQSYVLYQ